jgi:hypothetical protein
MRERFILKIANLRYEFDLIAYPDAAAACTAS